MPACLRKSRRHIGWYLNRQFLRRYGPCRGSGPAFHPGRLRVRSFRQQLAASFSGSVPQIATAACGSRSFANNGGAKPQRRGNANPDPIPTVVCGFAPNAHKKKPEGRGKEATGSFSSAFWLLLYCLTQGRLLHIPGRQATGGLQQHQMVEVIDGHAAFVTQFRKIRWFRSSPEISGVADAPDGEKHRTGEQADHHQSFPWSSWLRLPVVDSTMTTHLPGG